MCQIIEKTNLLGRIKGYIKIVVKVLLKSKYESESTYRLIDCMNEAGRNGYDLVYVPKK